MEFEPGFFTIVDNNGVHRLQPDGSVTSKPYRKGFSRLAELAQQIVNAEQATVPTYFSEPITITRHFSVTETAAALQGWYSM